jgi:hypothetical protein
LRFLGDRATMVPHSGEIISIVGSNQYFETNVRSRASVVLYAACAIVSASCARAQRTSTEMPSILHATGDSVTVQLLDAVTAKPVAGANIELGSDNGIRCVRAPCPTDSREWTGSSDASGRITIPTTVLNASVNLTSGVYHGDLASDASPGEHGAWALELFPDDSSNQPAHPLKLTDARTHEAIANTPVRIESRIGGNTFVNATTNALGYVFVPFAVMAKGEDNCWIVAPGYRDAHVDFAWVRHKMLLERK